MILNRIIGETIVICDDLITIATVTVLGIKGDQVRIGVNVTQGKNVYLKEMCNQGKVEKNEP